MGKSVGQFLGVGSFEPLALILSHTGSACAPYVSQHTHIIRTSQCFIIMFASSPFDEALTRPLVNDEDRPDAAQTKKFSWTSTVATVFTSMDDDEEWDDADDDELSYSYAAPIENIMTMNNNDDDDYDDEELSYKDETAPLVTVDLEQAVLQERHSDIHEITSNMKHLHDIQQDLAHVVESQDSDIQRMSWLAIEAFEETQGGVAQLQRSSSSMIMEAWIGRQRRHRQVAISILFGAMFLAAWAFHKLGNYEAADYSGDPQKFP